MPDICQTLNNRKGYCWLKKRTSKKFWPHCFVSLPSVQSIIVAKREGDWTIFDLRVLFFFFWENPGKTQERLLSKQELEMTVEIDKKKSIWYLEIRRKIRMTRFFSSGFLMQYYNRLEQKHLLFFLSCTTAT